MKLIANADDYGLSEGVNYGIIDAYKNGIVRSTTMMVGMPGEAHGVELAKEYPGLKIGIHLRLTAGHSLCKGLKTLTDETGQFNSQTDFYGNENICPEEVEKEFRAQIDHFISLGLKPTHLDSHHHCYGHPVAYPVVKKIASEMGIPLRTVDSKEVSTIGEYSYRFSDEFYGDVSEAMLLEIVDQEIASQGSNCILELMCHPAFIDPALYQMSSYCIQRVKETEILNSESLKQKLADRGVELTDYNFVSQQASP
ncbi:chitin disaccharide deacetylase [Endozoicomonas arenosclerae]|uniref:chitin disaccharide deacetylase n=1 Tax=Endozoicomonas arenosclerae TaxID=1633495 RepID=UPI000784733C|nr:chitin disaccharide deacetylase [Endozoicomonas arenosclerae]